MDAIAVEGPIDSFAGGSADVAAADGSMFSSAGCLVDFPSADVDVSAVGGTSSLGLSPVGG